MMTYGPQRTLYVCMVYDHDDGWVIEAVEEDYEKALSTPHVTRIETWQQRFAKIGDMAKRGDSWFDI